MRAMSQVSKREGKSPSASRELQQLHAEVRACTKCSLHATRTQAVPGVGPCPADVMIVGEAPGFNEDRQGEPVVGPPRQPPATLLRPVGLSPPHVSITNVLQHRPPPKLGPLPP